MGTQSDVLKFHQVAVKSFELIKALPHFVKLSKLTNITDPAQAVGLGWVLEETTAKFPGQNAILFEDRRITYDEFNRRANRFAHYFLSKGFKKGDVAAVFIENRPELLICVAALAKIGVVASMLNTSQTGKVLIHGINLVTPKLALVGGELVDVFNSVRHETSIPEDAVYFIADQDAFADAGVAPGGYINLTEVSAKSPETNPDTTRNIFIHDPCYYIYTSGTTGLPKAAVFTHGRLMRAYGACGHLAPRLKPGDVMYSTLPLYHSTALIICWGSCLISGAAFAIRRTFSVSEFWNDTRKFNATCFGYVGEICRYLMNQPPRPNDADNPVQKIVGNGMRPNIWKEFKERFGITHVIEGYGSSEGPVAFGNILNFDNTVGMSADGFAIVRYDKDAEQPIRNAKGFLEKVKKGEAGLLITEITNKTRFDGYTEKAKSDACVIRDAFKPGDAWYDTGDYMRDIGYRHAQFVDRLGDTYRWKGENVSTTEVENIMNEFDNIAETVAYGVEIPNTNGRAGMAAVIATDPGRPIEFGKLHAFLKNAMPPYAIPVFIRVRTSMATTGTFKYKKTDLKKEGFDPKQVRDPLYLLLPGGNAYEALTPEIYGRIMDGTYKY